MNKQIPQYILNNPEKYIPKGNYCYKLISYNQETNEIKKEICPFWDIDKTKPYQENGYCHYLKQGDWNLNPIYNSESKMIYSKNKIDIGKSVTELFGEHFPTSLIWDMCKECDINMNM